MYLLDPVYKDYIWGGMALRERFGKGINMPVVAESWELSTHKDGLTLIAGTGQTLRDRIGCDLPILVKLIDAHKSLSVQVHPDDAYAARTAGERGKTELWHVLSAEEGAFLYLGLKKAVAKEELERAIRDCTVERLLNKVYVKPGESYYIPAGMLHAIGAGCMVYEVQESSNLTYRVYDYGRTDAHGRPRELHIADALVVTTLAPVSSTPPGAGQTAGSGALQGRSIVRCPYFSLWKLRLDGKTDVPAQKSFYHLLCIEGSCTVSRADRRIDMSAGTGIFIAAGECVEAEGSAVLLAVSAEM